MCPGGAQRVQIGVWILALADFDVRILRARPLTGAGVGLHVQCTPARTRPGCAVAACAQMHAHAHARRPGPAHCPRESRARHASASEPPGACAAIDGRCACHQVFSGLPACELPEASSGPSLRPQHGAGRRYGWCEARGGGCRRRGA